MKKLFPLALLVFFVLPLGASAAITSNLSYGSRGTQVIALQDFLVNENYLSATNATGNFYSLTKQAVKAFQAANDLPDTGNVFALTRAAIQKYLLTSGESVTSPAAVATPVTPSLTTPTTPSVTSSLTPQISQTSILPPTSTASVSTTASSNTSSDWMPTWLAGTDIKSVSAWTPVNPYGCNADSFGTAPALGNLYIGRILNNTNPSDPCSGTNWSLTWATMNWSTNTITPGIKLLDTSLGPVTLGDGNVITSAYDASVAIWNNQIWVAFECYGTSNFKYAGASSCVGPLNSDLSLNLSRTAVVVGGTSYNSSDTYGYSASTPKLLNFNGTLYLYWTAIQYPKSNPTAWKSITTRGIQFTPGLGHVLSANDTSSVEVFGLNPSDLESNTVADLTQVITDGNKLYFTGSLGGGDCLNPGSSSAGCYRLAIGTASNPLGQDVFNQNMIPSSYLPPNPEEYYHFVYRPSDGKTVLIGGNFFNAQNDNTLNTGMKMLVWPDKLLQSVSLPYGYASMPSPSVPVSTPAVTASAVTTPTQPASNCGLVAVGTTLTPGQTIKSCNGEYIFDFQTDGNVVLYKGAITAQDALWATNTAGKSSVRLVMQSDGNLVLYDFNNNPLWASSLQGGKFGSSLGATGLSIQDDGNLVIYGAGNSALWSSNTAAAELGST